MPNPNLEFATLCLSNALMLTKDAEANQSLPSNKLTKQMVSKLNATILSNLCYTHLHLSEFTSALKYGLELLEQKDAPSSFRYLANMYCTEALVMMDRSQQVYPYTNPSLLKEFKAEAFESAASPGWQCHSFEVAKAIFHYNSSVSLVMQHQLVGSISLTKAGALLAKCNHPEILDHVMKLKVYLDLCCGNADLPRNIALIEDKCLK